ncbi:uncharacterized protein NPIL_562651 [Nephila pilipes]|uniref:Uncharacterized protein n=1 Tax=Nephila pilipes TaxID=299642 RepID=A0A8X6TP11_NEPPI|nr:uncharacterized protein NPIL_562651 [Nephila pilipes]
MSTQLLPLLTRQNQARDRVEEENVSEFLVSIDNKVLYVEIPTNLACPYLKGHLIGRAKDWFEVIGSSYVTGTATDFAQLKQALTNSFPVVGIRG